MQYIKKILNQNKLLIFIVFISAFLRIATVSKLMVFTPDEEYLTYLAVTIIKNFHIIWIGISAGSFGVYYGPLWIYIITPLLMLTRGDPIILGYFGASLGIITTLVIYVIGKESFGKRTGIVASLLYATSALVTYYDQKGYPSGVTLLSVLMIWALLNFKKSKYFLLLFTVSFALAFSVHLSLLPIGAVALYAVWQNRRKFDRKIILLCGGIFILIMSPLIAFDYFHKGSNILAPLRVIALMREGTFKANIPYHSGVFFDSMGRVFYLAPGANSSDEILYPCSLTTTSTRTIPPTIISSISVITIIIFMVRRRTWKDTNTRYLALLSIVLIFPFITSAFINPVEYYLLPFFPVLFLIFGNLTETLKGKSKLVTYLVLFIVSLLGVITVLSAKGDYGHNVKADLVNKVMEKIGDAPYSLSEAGDCHKYEAWRYMFSVLARRPEQSSEDSVYGWIYTDELSKVKPKFSVVMAETKIDSEEVGYKYKLEEGGFSAFIYERK